jgi:hypothetical protein
MGGWAQGSPSLTPHRPGNGQDVKGTPPNQPHATKSANPSRTGLAMIVGYSLRRTWVTTVPPPTLRPRFACISAAHAKNRDRAAGAASFRSRHSSTFPGEPVVREHKVLESRHRSPGLHPIRVIVYSRDPQHPDCPTGRLSTVAAQEAAQL